MTPCVKNRDAKHVIYTNEQGKIKNQNFANRKWPNPPSPSVPAISLRHLWGSWH
jgi:hypothetical protein